MTPRKLSLRRVCQHDEKEIVFADGLNSIVGPNGSGKSNIMHALCLCIGQDTNLKGKKTDMIQDGYDKAEIFLEFVHRDTHGTIKVTLKRNYNRNWDEQSLLIDQAKAEVERQQVNPAYPVDESTMKFATFTPRETTGFSMDWGDTKCRNGTELGEWMRQEVGVDPKLVVTTFFPSQGDIDGALSADKGERQAVFAAKAGTGLCELMWSMLGKELVGLEDFTGVDERHAQAKANKAVAQARLSEIEPQWQIAESMDLDTTKWNQILQAYTKATGDRQRLGGFHEELAKQNAVLTAAGSQVALVLTDGQILRTKFDTLKPMEGTLLQSLARAELSGKRESQRKEYIRDMSSAKEQFTAALNAVPQEPPSDASLTDIAGQVAMLQQQTQRLEAYIATFRTGKCPTCGAEVVAAEKIREYEIQMKESREQAGSLGAQKVSLEGARKQLNAAKTNWEAKVTSLRAKIAQLEAVLSTMPETEALMTPVELESTRAHLTEIRELEATLLKTRESYDALLRTQDKARNQVELLAKQIQGLEEALVSAPAEEAYRNAVAALEETQRNQVAYNDIKVQLGIANGRYEDAHVALADAAAAAARVGPQRIWKARVEQARDLLHRDSLPSEVVAWYAAALVNHTMNYLKLFEVSFSVIVTPDLGLLAIFADKAMPVAKLSGGEKNMLNISMRLAMADLFPSDLRLLVLDEVEVHLDQTNVAKLPMLLEKVKCLARNRGLVVLFVSHHPSLRDIADNVVYSKDVA